MEFELQQFPDGCFSLVFYYSQETFCPLLLTHVT